MATHSPSALHLLPRNAVVSSVAEKAWEGTRVASLDSILVDRLPSPAAPVSPINGEAVIARPPHHAKPVPVHVGDQAAWAPKAWSNGHLQWEDPLNSGARRSSLTAPRRKRTGTTSKPPSGRSQPAWGCQWPGCLHGKPRPSLCFLHFIALTHLIQILLAGPLR